MSDIKTFSDYEASYIEKNKDKTIGELMDFCPSPDDPSNFYGTDKSPNTLMTRMKQDFFDFSSKEEGFLDIPILGAIYNEDNDVTMYAVQEYPAFMYKSIYYNRFDGFFRIIICQTLNLCPTDFKTIGDVLYPKRNWPKANYRPFD